MIPTPYPALSESMKKIKIKSCLAHQVSKKSIKNSIKYSAKTQREWNNSHAKEHSTSIEPALKIKDLMKDNQTTK